MLDENASIRLRHFGPKVCTSYPPNKQVPGPELRNFAVTTTSFALMPQAIPPTYPCPKCRRWFKNKSGLTQHLNAKHSVSTQAQSQTSGQRDNLSPLRSSPAPEGFAPRSSPAPGWFAPRSSPSPDVETEFFGPGGKLYRNYHKLLNGKCSSRYHTI